jgi:MFS family permease
LRSLVVVLGIFSVVNFPDALLLLRAHDLGLSTAGVIGAYIVYNAVYAAASYPAGALSDRAPRHLVFAAGLGFFAIGYLGLGLAQQPGWVYLILPLYGGFAACTDGVGKVWVAEPAPAGRQGGAQGLFQAVTGAGVLLSGVVAGLAWDGDGRVPLLTSGSVGAVLAVVLVAVGGRWRAGASR